MCVVDVHVYVYVYEYVVNIHLLIARYAPTLADHRPSRKLLSQRQITLNAILQGQITKIARSGKSYSCETKQTVVFYLYLADFLY